MESTALFEKKVSLTPGDLNTLGATETIDTILLKKLKSKLEDKCSEHGFVLPGSVNILSRSMGYFEPARFTGDAVYYVKAEGRVLYPADGIQVEGEVIRKNKMGLYLAHREGLRIQVPRDLNLGDEEFENVQLGDIVKTTLKKSLFQINDPFILTNGLFVERVVRQVAPNTVVFEEEAEAEAEVPNVPVVETAKGPETLSELNALLADYEPGEEGEEGEEEEEVDESIEESVSGNSMYDDEEEEEEEKNNNSETKTPL